MKCPICQKFMFGSWDVHSEGWLFECYECGVTIYSDAVIDQIICIKSGSWNL